MMVSLTNNQRHDAYWKQRMDDILRYVDEVDIELFAELTELYGEFSRRVQKEVFAFYSKYAQENELTLQEAKKKLRGMDLSDYQANARRYLEDTRDNPELWRRLNEQYQSSQGLRLDALELELDYRIGQLNEQVTRRFDQYVRQVAGYAYQKIVNDISRVPINQPALEQVIMRPWNGYNYSEAVWGNTHHLAEHLKKVFKNGFIRGLSAREIASDVRKQFDVAKHRAETLVRTEGTHIVNSATTQRYREFGLKYYQLHIHLDNRTSAICKRLAKADKTYALDEAEPGVTAPPFHYNCRTTMIPSEEELNEEHWVEDEHIKGAHGAKYYERDATMDKWANKEDVSREKHAYSQYNAIKNRNAEHEIEKIYNNLRGSQEYDTVEKQEIRRAFNHVFHKKHQLENGYGLFDPDYDMAQSWTRLIDGKSVYSHDITLLYHEAYESKLMQEKNMNYEDAHLETQKYFNYTRDVKEFNERRGK